MLKKITLLIIVLGILNISNASANTLIERTINWYSAKIIEYKTDSEIYDIKIWVHPDDWWTLRSIMWTVGWITWVNGVFECPKDYAACGGKNYTINERYVEGEKKATYKSTWDRVVFGWDENIVPFLFQTDLINASREWDIFEWFANHPLLLKDWISQTHIYHEKWLIDYKMKSKATKNFICSNQSWDTIYFGLLYWITIDDTAIALKDFGCWNAINLDAGASTTFIYNWKYILNPQRDILDWVFIVPKNIDTKALELEAKNTINTMLETTRNQSTQQKITSFSKLNSTLNSMSQEIYKNNTFPEYENIKTYSHTIVFENVSWNEKVQRLVKSDVFLNNDILYFKNNTIYKKDFAWYTQREVWTKIEITKQQEIEKIYLTNLLRHYTSSLIETFKEIEKLEYIKTLDLNLKINVEL